MDENLRHLQLWQQQNGAGAAPGINNLLSKYAPAKAKPKKEGGLSGFVKNNLETIGQIGGGVGGGAAGGALAGTAILPGVGTGVGALIGGLLGSFGGGALGESAKRASLGQEQDLGESLKQGAIGSANELVGAGIGAVGSKVLGKLIGKGAEVAGETAAKGAEKGLVQKGAENILASSRGVRPGMKVAGQDALGVADSTAMNKFLNEVGVQSGSAAKQLGQLEKVHSGWQNELGGILSAKNQNLAPESAKELANTLRSRITENVLGDDVLADSAVKDALGRIGNAKDIKEVNGLISKVDSKINFLSNADRAQPEAQQALKELRGGLRDYVSQAIPETADLNGLLSQSHTAQDFLKGAARNPEGIKILGNRVGGQLLQGGASQAAHGVKKGADLTYMLSRLTNPVVSRSVAPIIEKSNGEQPVAGDELGAQPVTDADLGLSSPEPSSGMFGGVDINSMVQRALSAPDAKSQAAQLDLIGKLVDLQGKINPQGKGLNSTSAQTVTDLQSGIGGIKQLGQEFASSGVNMPFVGGLRGMNPFDTGAQNLQADTARIKQVIGKALEGGVLRKEDEEKYAKILPTLNDSDEVAQHKIDTIAADLQRKLGLYQQNLGSSGGGGDITSLLMGAQ